MPLEDLEQPRNDIKELYAIHTGTVTDDVNPIERTIREMKRAFSTILSTLLFLLSMHVPADVHKSIVGATEEVFVKEANLSIRARVDTGAKTSSIHAENIKCHSTGDPRGQPITFDLVTKEGRSKKVESRVISVVKVKTSEQTEQRYVVPLHIQWKDLEKIIPVTLNDRGSMDYRLLLGRNWLRGDFIVDVDKNNED